MQKETRQMNKKKRRTLFAAILVFAAIAILYMVIQTLSGLYPFGDKLNLLWDEDIQYVDYFAFYRDVLLGKAQIGYSFSKSLGGSLVALFGYYLASPFNLLVVFFDTEHLPLFVFLITMLKMGTAGVTSFAFMRGRFEKLSLFASAGLSVGYGLMQYTMLQCSNIMWLDGVIFLPLLLLSIYRFVTEKRKVPLFLCVAFSIMINWYTGYMICLFGVCYYLYERILMLFKESASGKWKRFFLDSFQCAGVMLLGLFGSMVVFYPVFKGLQKGKSVWDPTIFAPEFYDSFFDIFRGFGVGTIAGTVSLYCGLLFFGFFVYYFLAKSVEKKEKILSAVAVLFMFASCWFVPLDCIWSGVRHVASFRFRYSFVVIFLVLYLAARGILVWEKSEEAIGEQKEKKHGGIWKKNRKMAAIFGGILIAFLASHLWKGYEVKTFYATMISLILYVLIYLILKQDRARWCALSILLGAELVANGVITFAFNYGWNPSVEAYQTYAKEAKVQADLVKKSAKPSTFYRMETVSKRYNEESHCSAYLNDSMAYGYHGISHYSSTYDTNISDMIHDLGYSSTYDLSIYTEPILPADALFGIRYVLSRQDLLGLQKVERLGTVNEKQVYENPYALGIGMGVSDQVFDWTEPGNPFEFQNQLYSKLLGENVELFRKIEAEPVVQDGVLSYQFPALGEGSLLYGDVESKIGELNTTLYVDGTYRCKYSCWLSYLVFAVGESEQPHTVSFTDYAGTAEDVDGSFYQLDLKTLEQVTDRLKENGFEPEVFKDGRVEGTYECKEPEGNLLLTIPYDEGWKAWVNGESVRIREGANALSVIPVTQGENEVKLVYEVPGVRTGRVLSLGAVFVFGVWLTLEKHGKQRKCKE